MRFTGIVLFVTAIAFTAFAAPEKSAENKTAKTQKSAPAKKNPAKKNQPKKRTPPPASVDISTLAPNGGDVTRAMLQAIKSRTPQIIFSKPGIYQLQPVTLYRPVQIILNDRVTIKAMPQAPASKGQKVAKLPGLFTGDRVRGIQITGKGNALIVGDKLPIFAFRSSNNISISKLTVSDGEAAVDAYNCWGFRLTDVVFDNFSVSAAMINGGGWNGLTNLQFRNIKGRALTIVADSNGRVPNMTLENCEFFNNNDSVKVLAPAKFTIKPVDLKKNPKYRPPRLNFRSCRFFNNTGIDLEIYGALADGFVRVDNSVFTTPHNTAIKFTEFTTGDGLKAEIAKTSIRPEQENRNIPVEVTVTQDKPFGNITFTKTTVKQPVHKKAIKYNLKKNQGNIAGKLQVVSNDGNVKNAELVMEGK